MVSGSNGYAEPNAKVNVPLIWIEILSREVEKVSQLFLSLCFHLEVKLLLRNLPEVTENAFPWKKVFEQRPKGYLSADIEQVQSIS